MPAPKRISGAMVALGIGEVDEEPDPMLVSHSSRVGEVVRP